MLRPRTYKVVASEHNTHAFPPCSPQGNDARGGGAWWGGARSIRDAAICRRCCCSKHGHVAQYRAGWAGERPGTAHKHIGCLHTCNKHTLVQSTLLHPFTPYTGALTYTTTIHEPANTQPCTSLQMPTQPYKRIIQPLHA